jgi:hypothetical protein
MISYIEACPYAKILSVLRRWVNYAGMNFLFAEIQAGRMAAEQLKNPGFYGKLTETKAGKRGRYP